MTHANSERGEQIEALDRTMERMRKIVADLAHSAPVIMPGFPYDFAALRVTESVARLGTPTIKDVAADCGVDHSTTSRAVASAQRQGLLTRTTHPDDRRQVMLSLTEQGQQISEQMPALRQHMLDESLHDWSAQELSQFREFLERFRVVLEKNFSNH